jgi:hypothetical protein
VKYQVWLRACLPEHEGQDGLCETFETSKEAQKYIRDNSREYFFPTDFYIVEKLESEESWSGA